MEKIPVKVNADFMEYEKIVPRCMYWEDRRFEIDRVTDVRRAASQKLGVAGIRYTCMIRGKVVYLYLVDYLWYMERVG